MLLVCLIDKRSKIHFGVSTHDLYIWLTFCHTGQHIDDAQVNAQVNSMVLGLISHDEETVPSPQVDGGSLIMQMLKPAAKSTPNQGSFSLTLSLVYAYSA